jgi:hypothetical protein
MHGYRRGRQSGARGQGRIKVKHALRLAGRPQARPATQVPPSGALKAVELFWGNNPKKSGKLSGATKLRVSTGPQQRS